MTHRGTTQHPSKVMLATWALLFVSPLVSIAIISAVTGTSPFVLDAWNTTWNDELHYWRTISLMRDWGLPQGIAGYNESPALDPSHAFGPYNALTYLPYLFGSLFTGYPSHNFMYVTNVTMALSSSLIIIAICRPPAKRAGLLAIFFASQFVVTRYAISGMVEESYVLFAVIFTCCTLRLAGNGSSKRRSERIAISFVLSLSLFFWGTMRPFLLVYAVIPAALTLWGLGGGDRAERALRLSIIIACVICAFLVYRYSSARFQAHYFESSATSAVGQLLSGEIGLGDIVRLNIDGLADIWANILAMNRCGVITLCFFLGFICLAFMALRAVRENDRQRSLVIIGLLVAGFLMYEANLVLYEVAQMHRMLIAIDVSYTLAIVLLSENREHIVSIAFIAFCACCTTVALCVAPNSYALPQAGESLASDSVTEFAKVMPRMQNAWDNTMAKTVDSEDLALFFALPSYIQTNTCQDSYLESALEADSLRSKYLCLQAASPLNKLAAATGAVIYNDNIHIIYRMR